MIFLASLAEKIADKVEGYYFIKTKEELDKVVADNSRSNKIIIRRDFAKENFTPSGLLKFIENAKKINRNLIIEVDKKSKVLTGTKFINMLKNARNLEELMVLLTTYPKEFIDSIQQLTSKSEDEQKELLAASNTVSGLQVIIDEQKKEIEDLKYQLKFEQENKFEISARLSALVNRINYQYNINVDETKLFQVSKNNYDKVIYIKEITRVQYIDTLVYYLKEILRVLYSMPTRLVVIESYYGSGCPRLYPKLTPHYALKERNVISGDILMMGIQPKLMEDILKNPSNISILIILDRANYVIPHLRGENIEYFYTASDLKDVSDDIPNSRIISYSEKTLFIPLIKNFEAMGNGEKMSAYSSTTIMKRLIATIEGR